MKIQGDRDRQTQKRFAAPEKIKEMKRYNFIIAVGEKCQ